MDSIETILEEFERVKAACQQMEGKKIRVGIVGAQSSEVLAIAHAHEYGVPGKLPERSFIRKSFDADQEKLQNIVAGALVTAISRRTVDMAENVNETVMSVIGNPTAIEESSLKTETIGLEVRADALVVTNEEEYQDAAEFLKTLKGQAGKVKDFFKPLKDAAYKAHKEVCDREKMMLDPLTKAESVIKKAVGTYLAEQERKRKAAEERARQAAKEEADRRLAEAIALENQGKTEEAAAAVEEAEIIDSATVAVPVAPTTKVKGVSSSKDWEIVGINDAKVPVAIAGTVIRPVDSKAIMRIIRASKGTIQIPGVTYKEVMKMSVRRS